MKTKILILAFLTASFFMVGCKNDDDNGNNNAITIEGVWYLNNVKGGFLGVDIDYERDEVIWNFNFNTAMLTVQNNLSTTDPDYSYAGPESGTYGFEISEVDGVAILMIEGIDTGVYIVTSSSLVIDDSPNDGFKRTFER